MFALYKLRANELDEAFVETLKSQFGEREIEVAVCEAAEVQQDEPAPHYTLEELLEGISVENLHGEVDTGPPVGREVW